MKRNISFIIPFLILIALPLCLYLLARAVSTTQSHRGQLPHELYVWQRQWDSSLASALERSESTASGFIVLAAEVSWAAGLPNVTKVALDYRALKESKCPVGLALRIGPFRGAESEYSQHTAFLAELSQNIIRQASEHGIDVAELQLDFDAAESKLTAYRTWVTGIRQAVPDIPLTITALPSWLKQRSFVALAQATDGYVLQVHSLERPAVLSSDISLCRPEKARQWVQQAGRIGVPFRVALPTYSYLIVSDQQGRFLRLSAEGPTLDWNQNYRGTYLRSDPIAMQKLVRDWTASRPQAMIGVIWYRLPVESDSLNWSWHTLRKIISDEQLLSAAQLRVTYTQKALAELAWENTGDVDETLPEDVTVNWNGAKLIAADGLGGFSFSSSQSTHNPNSGLLQLAKDQPLPTIGPGREYKIGWLRFDKEVKIDAQIPNSK